MHDLVVEILRHARGAWRFRWAMLVTAWLICIIGWIVVATLPDVYEAEAKVNVDTTSVLRPILGGLALSTGNSERKLALVSRTMLSRPNLEKVMRMTDLDLKAKTSEDKEAIIDNLAGKIQFRGTKQNDMYTIAYNDHSPELAKLVVTSLLTIFMESNLGEERKNQDTQEEFLDQQIQEYERRLSEAESLRENFKKQNLGYLPSQGGDYYQRLSQAKSSLKQSTLELKIEKDRLAALKKELYAGQKEQKDAGNNNIGVDTREFDQRIFAMQQKLDDLLFRYTEKHPEVVITRRTLEDLEKDKQDYIEENKDAVVAQDLSNPFVQQLKLNISAIESNIAAKTVMVNDYQNQIKELEAAVDRVLRVESEEKQINRDYEILKSNLGKLMSTREASRLAKSADATSNSTQFKVIEPPRVPSTPAGPPRVLFGIGIFVFAIGVGFGLAILLSQLRPTFDDRAYLQSVTDLPVLGSVDMVWTHEQISARKRRNYSFLLAFSFLFAAFSLVTLMFAIDVDLFTRIESLMESI